MKLLGYTDSDEYVDMSERNIYLIARKYEKIDGKDAAKTGAKLTLSTAAGLIIPGIDIAYYFTKGVIQNTKADTRFKSGVHNAYDNSIMWFFLKGKSIALNEGDMITDLIYTDSGITTKSKNKKKNCRKAKTEKSMTKEF